MEDPAVTSALYWLGWMPVMRNIAAALVAIGVVMEFAEGWMSEPWRKIVDDARTAEFARLSTESDKAQAAIAEANARALEAQAELAKFKAPRELSFDQIARIAEKIKPFSGQEYALSVASGTEADNLLCTVNWILERAGWKRHNPFGEISTETKCGTVGINMTSGVHVRASLDANLELHQRANVLASALRAEGIEADPERDPKNIPIPTVIYVMIGTKPQ